MPTGIRRNGSRSWNVRATPTAPRSAAMRAVISSLRSPICRSRSSRNTSTSTPGSRRWTGPAWPCTRSRSRSRWRSAPPAFGLKLCQTFNDACAAVHERYPDRFVGLAMLPMQDPALAVQEFDRVAKLAGIRGIYMATHINGRNLDEKDFWPVYARCPERGLPILLHPVNPVGADRMGGYHLRNFI